MIAAFFFDMDNTLVNTEWAAGLAVRQAVESYGRSFSKEDEEAVVGLPWDTIFKNSVNDYQLPVNTETFKEQVLTAKELILQDKLEALPGAVQALRRCTQYAPVAVVSGSYRREIEATMQALGIQNDIRFIVSNEDVQPGKPTPGPYLEAARRLHVAPRSCVVFEDSEMGIASAKAAGMLTIAVEAANTTGMDLSGADLVLDTLLRVTDSWLIELQRRIGENT